MLSLARASSTTYVGLNVLKVFLGEHLTKCATEGVTYVRGKGSLNKVRDVRVLGVGGKRQVLSQDGVAGHNGIAVLLYSLHSLIKGIP